jgi:hypothetical protein
MSYADKRRRDLSFEVGDSVYHKVSPMRGTYRYKVKGKLAPRYVGPFKIFDHKEKSLINWNYRLIYLMYLMYFLCRS